jgi:hypothetical protein
MSSNAKAAEETMTRGRADIEAEIKKADDKLKELGERDARGQATLADVQVQLKAARANSLLDDDPAAALKDVKRLEAERDRLTRELQAVDDAGESLDARIEDLQQELGAYLLAADRAELDTALTALETLSDHLDREVLPVFVRECEAWLAAVEAVTSLAGLPGARTAESQLGEAMYLHFRKLMPSTFRSLASVPHAARGFADWAHRARVRGEKNFTERTALPAA